MPELALSAVRQRLIASTASIDEIAVEAGFNDAETLNAECLKRCFISPQAYRDLPGASSFVIDLPPWLRREGLFAYWGRDPNSLSEKVHEGHIAWATDSLVGPLRVDAQLETDRARIEIRTEDFAAADPMMAVHAYELIIRWLGLHLDPRPFERQTLKGPHGRLIQGRHGLTLPQTSSVFDAVLWVIAGQQVSLAAAFSIRRRLTDRFGTKVAGLTCSPSASTLSQVAPQELFQHGLTRRKAEYLSGIAHLATATATESDLPTARTPAPHLESWRRQTESEVETHLLAIRGLGAWSVNYLLMRAFGFPDRVPVGDAALARALQRFFALDARPKAEETLELTAPFAPYRSLASFHFWATLSSD